MPETLALIAIAIIVAGFLVLAGVAIWLALERRQHRRPAKEGPAAQPGRSLAAQKEPPAGGSPTASASRPEPAARPAPVDKETPTPADAAKAAPAGPSLAGKDPDSSGHYPAANKYDQTWLPGQPKRRTRSKTE